MRIETPAKVNLSLRVRPPDQSGYHPLHSLVQTIDPLDELVFEVAAEDHLTITGIRMPAQPDNLIWRALRIAAPDRTVRLSISLNKRIPSAAGLGGGSSDAAAALLAAEKILGVPYSVDTAAAIGADVPLFRSGGLVLMEGYGEKLSSLTATADYTLALVVPPFDLGTPAVYAEWDRLGEPAGSLLEGADLPPSLRGFGGLVNDLYPAAVSLAPELDDWRSELERRWGAPVFMSGSGPSLFGLFGSVEEATEAAALSPPGSRFNEAVTPLGHGTRLIDAG